MNETRVPDEGAPNAGEGVSDDTEPAAEYELDQVTDERDDHEDRSVADEQQATGEK